MIAVPAVDLRGGACVQLVGGDFDEERIRLPDSLAAARRWRDFGFSRLHVVDLDAAAGTGSNAAQIGAILTAETARTTVGGGIRTSERIAELLGAGAESVIVGTRAIDDPAWLEELAWRHVGRLIVAADVRDRAIVTRAWTTKLAIDVTELIHRVEPLPIGGILVTAVHREGRLAGPDLSLMEEVVASTTHPVVASGGITTLADLRELQARGVSSCVIGMALYSGALDPIAVASEFGQ
jgi:phosphoribosylformimino-5-aminoimidazole carboxamide ribotide isomerase